MLLEGRHAMITGAGPGLGRTLALLFAKEGADVTLVARTTDTRAMASAAFDAFGRIDVLVKSAFPGSYRRQVLDMDDDELERWRRAVEIGAFGTLLASRFVA